MRSSVSSDGRVPWYARVGGPDHRSRYFGPVALAVHPAGKRSQLADLLARENGDVPASASGLDAESCERVLIGQVVLHRVREHRAERVHRARMVIGPGPGLHACHGPRLAVLRLAEEPDAFTVVLHGRLAPESAAMPAPIVIRPSGGKRAARLLTRSGTTSIAGLQGGSLDPLGLTSLDGASKPSAGIFRWLSWRFLRVSGS
jgi:hypothetical protein